MTYQVDDGDDGGAILGRSSGKVGFYGTTPATIPTVTSNVTIAFSAAFTGMWAFQNSTRAAQFVTQVQDIAAALKTLGLVAEG
jgi:hypothetical protein